MSKMGIFEDKSLCGLYSFDDPKVWNEDIFIKVNCPYLCKTNILTYFNHFYSFDMSKMKVFEDKSMRNVDLFDDPNTWDTDIFIKVNVFIF